MRRIIVFLVFILFAFGVYYIKQDQAELDSFSYQDDFEVLDETFWYVGEWKSMLSAYEKVKLNSGILKLEIDEVDKGPVLLSKPIEVGEGQVLTIKRKVRLEHTDAPFFGGFAILETEDEGLVPSVLNGQANILGDGVVLIEYAQGTIDNPTRPGRNVFRVLPRTWIVESRNQWIPGIFSQWLVGNYHLIKPKYDQWIEETLIFDNDSGTITYILDDTPYEVWTEKLKSNHVRIYMHGYGHGTGHSVEMDWIEISVE